MSATEKAVKDNEETITTVQNRSSETENKAQKPLMYVGPTIPGIAIQNTVYEPIPGAAKDAAKELPVFLDLFIPIMKYPDAERQIRKKSGRLYSAFVKALVLRNKGGKAE